jgi:AraC family transcriptional activator of pobA
VGEECSADLFLWDNTQLYDFEEKHSHTFNEILIFTKGGGKHIMSGQNYPISDNSFHILPSNYTHQLQRSSQSEGFTIAFSTSFINHLEQYDRSVNYSYFITAPAVICLEGESFQEFGLYFNELIRYRGNKHYFLNLLAVFFHKILLSKNDILQAPHDNFQHVILKLIEQHCTQKPNITFYSNLLNITAGTLSRKVKGCFGKTIMDIQNEKIIEKAKEMLQLKSYTVKEVSYHFNFTDESHFCHFFKHHTGVSPKEFAKR